MPFQRFLATGLHGANHSTTKFTAARARTAEDPVRETAPMKRPRTTQNPRPRRLPSRLRNRRRRRVCLHRIYRPMRPQGRVRPRAGVYRRTIGGRSLFDPGAVAKTAPKPRMSIPPNQDPVPGQDGRRDGKPRPRFRKAQRDSVPLVWRGHAPLAEIVLALQQQPPGAVVAVANAAQVSHEAVAVR
jgi:hypothetical protein